MKLKLFATAILLTVTATLNAQYFNWTKTFGDIADDQCTGSVVDALGNVYVTGIFADTVDFDPGPNVFNLTASTSSIFILKLDDSGNFVWAKSIASLLDEAVSIGIDASANIYIGGNFSDTVDFDPGVGVYNLFGLIDGFVCKLDANGNFIYAKQFGGADLDLLRAMKVLPTGEVLITGLFNTTADFDPGNGVFNLTSFGDIDIFVCKINALGNFVWAKQMGGPDLEQGIAIDADAAGNVYIAGAFDHDGDYDPGAGVFTLTANSDKIFIVKLNASGNFQWANGVVGYFHNLTADAANGIIICGTFFGTQDFDPGLLTFNLSASAGAGFILKLTTAGNFTWAKQMDGSPDEIKTDAVNNIYLAGIFNGTVDFDPGALTYNLTAGGNIDGFICKWDMSGNFISAVQVGGTNSNAILHPESIVIDATNNLYVCGTFGNTIDFDPSAATYNITCTPSPFGAFYFDVFALKMSSIPLSVLEKNAENNFSVYPNPATNKFQFQGFKFHDGDKVQIFNVMGKEIYQSLVIGQQLLIDVSKFENGIYFVQLTSPASRNTAGAGLSSQKLIIQH